MPRLNWKRSDRQRKTCVATGTGIMLTGLPRPAGLSESKMVQRKRVTMRGASGCSVGGHKGFLKRNQLHCIQQNCSYPNSSSHSLSHAPLSDNAFPSYPQKRSMKSITGARAQGSETASIHHVQPAALLPCFFVSFRSCRPSKVRRHEKEQVTPPIRSARCKVQGRCQYVSEIRAC